MSKLTDDSPMPFGKYQGTKMANVPAPYLLYLHDKKCDHPAVAFYIKTNLDILQKENSRIHRR